MTEKRYRKVLGLIKDNQADDDGLLDLGDIEDRLNEQDSEIQYLKPLADENTNYINDLEDENIRLKQENQQLKCDLKTLRLQDEDMKVYQRTLEAKIRRLKDRIKVFEKNYGSKDIQRIKDGELKGVLKGDYK